MTFERELELFKELVSRACMGGYVSEPLLKFKENLKRNELAVYVGIKGWCRDNVSA
jgi:hypothetical protein